MNKFFSFDVITPFHLISALSFCLSKAKSGDCIFLYYIKNMNGDYFFRDTSFETSDGVTVLIKRQEVVSRKPMYFYFILSKTLGFFKKKRVNFFVGHHTYFKPTIFKYFDENLVSGNVYTFSFEEGIGSYNGFLQEKAVAKRENKNFFLLKYILKKILSCSFFVDYKWGLIDPSLENKELPKLLHLKASSLIKSEIFSDDDDVGLNIKCKNRAVLYFSTPLVRLGVLTKNEYFLFLSFVKSFFEEKGCYVYFKLHPLENKDDFEGMDYSCLLTTKKPAEMLVMESNFLYVAGVNSGAMITSSIMKGVKAINFYDALPIKAKGEFKLNKSLQAVFDEYAPSYLDYWYESDV